LVRLINENRILEDYKEGGKFANQIMLFRCHQITNTGAKVLGEYIGRCNLNNLQSLIIAFRDCDQVTKEGKNNLQEELSKLVKDVRIY